MNDQIEDQITLTPYLRALLMEEICSRIDIVEYYQFILDAPFTRGIRNTFEGACPFCKGNREFVINAHTGKYFCTTCGCEGDFLTLLNKTRHLTLDAALGFLSKDLKIADERILKSRYTTETACTGGWV
jgi:hypothetical protein